MGHRLTKIYTRTGDNGSTGLGDGTRTDKDSLRVEAMGCVDELNSYLGLLLSHELPQRLAESFTDIQHGLFDLGGELSIPGHERLSPAQVTHLEEVLDELNADLPPLKEFILPGGAQAAAICHVARSVCRRAERRLVNLAREESVSSVSLQYINRLSDLLFVAARAINRQQGQSDILWQSGSRPE